MPVHSACDVAKISKMLNVITSFLSAINALERACFFFFDHELLLPFFIGMTTRGDTDLLSAGAPCPLFIEEAAKLSSVDNFSAPATFEDSL